MNHSSELRNRYSAYISPAYGYASEVLECGITIREPARVDYGVWRCDLGVGYPPDMHGSVLRIDHPDSREHRNIDAKGRVVKIRADGVYVKRGDPFTVNSRHQPRTRLASWTRWTREILLPRGIITRGGKRLQV